MASVERLRLRRFNIGDGFSLSFGIWLRRLPTILTIVLTTHAPISLVIWYLEEANRGFIWDTFAPIAEFLLRVLGVMALVFLVEREIAGQPVDFHGALNRAFDRWSAGVGAASLVLLVMVPATLLLIVPGIIASVFLAFTIPAVVLRNRSGWGALEYSKSLVTGHWWRIFGYLLGIGLAVFLLPGVGSFLVRQEIITLAGADFAVRLLVDAAKSLLTVATTLLFLNLDHFAHPPEVAQASEVAAAPLIPSNDST